MPYVSIFMLSHRNLRFRIGKYRNRPGRVLDLQRLVAIEPLPLN